MAQEHCNYIFMDESGDSGFKLAKGSTEIFCIAAVIFQSPEDINRTEAIMRRVGFDLGLKQTHEFHFHNEPEKFRLAFCRAVCGGPFKVRAIVVDKELIYGGPMLQQSPKHFYNFTAKMLLQHSFGSITSARVRIDGRISRDLKTYLRQEFNRETRVIRDTKFSDSKTDSMIQLADMVAGSIARSYKTEKKDCGQFRHILRPCIEDVWDFGKK